MNIQFLLTTILFLFSSVYVIIVDYLAISSRSFQKALVLPILFLVIALYRLPKIIKTESLSYEKWLFLFWGNIFMQMLILSTGGLQSPFLILLHLSLIGLSLFFSFSFGFLFLIFFLIVIMTDSILHHTILQLFLENPGSIILEFTSLVAIVPVAYIVSYKYHVRDWLFSKLRAKVVTDEVILDHLNELIIITDKNLNILSVNDAVEQTLMLSRSELLYKPFFTMFIFKDSSGKVATKETFFPDGDTSNLPKTNNDIFMLFRSAIPQKEVIIQVQPIKDEDNHINQISFIISYIKNPAIQTETATMIGEKARVKYEAMAENLKNKLLEINAIDLWMRSVLLEKIESDMYNLHLLKEYNHSGNLVRIDLSQLCRKVTLLEKKIAKAFGIEITFSLRNFGMKDIAPLLAGNFTVTPEEFTGPFFTALCDVKRMELIVKKLLDLCVFLASTEMDSQISVNIERNGKDMLIIQIISNCPVLNKEDLPDLFTPYYGKLYKQTNLHLGSGLEGYLVKTASSMTETTIDTQLVDGSQFKIAFTITVNKNYSPSL